MGNAAKVGGLVVVFIAMLLGAYAFLGKSLFGPKFQTFYASFPDAGGITPGTRILLAGVNIGLVTSVELASPTEAKATLAVKPGIDIPAGSKLLLPSSLVGLGEQVILLNPPKDIKGNLATGSTIPGGKAGALDGILPNAPATVEELTKTMAAFRKLLEDPELTGGLKKLMATTNATMGEFGKTAGSFNNVINSNQANLTQTLVAMRDGMQNINGLTKELYVMAKSGKIQGDLTATMANLRSATEKGDKLMTEINALVSDPDLRASLKGSAANITAMTESGAKMAKNGEAIAANVEKMSVDGPDISRKISELMTKANEIADDIKGITQEVKGSVGKVTEVLTKSPTSAFSNMQTRFDLIAESEPGFLRTDFTTIFPSSNGDSFQLGLWNAFESNQFIAQQSKKIDDNLSLRYGIFASKPGFGVDYLLGSRASLRADVFSLNDPRFDLRMRYEIGKGVVGWIGVNKMFKDNSPMIGFGVVR